MPNDMPVHQVGLLLSQTWAQYEALKIVPLGKLLSALFG